LLAETFVAAAFRRAWVILRFALSVPGTRVAGLTCGFAAPHGPA
jgi:hypothetical protein